MLIKHQGILIASLGNVMNKQQVSEFLAQNELEIPLEELEFSYERDEALAARKVAYETESDALFIEWQFDQTDSAKQAWLSKVAEIKARYPLSN